MHEFDESTDDLAWAIFRYALDRVKTDPPLDGPRSHQELWEAVGQTITDDGIGGESALAAFADHLAPACLSTDHPRFLSFVPGAPTNASVLFDLVVGASAMCATSWLEAAGTVYAENQALRWVADLVGLPEGAGGCFASGGTMGNLSALIAARDDAMRRREAEGSGRPVRWAVVVSDGAHSSINSAARVMDVDVLLATTGDDRRLRGDEVRAAIAARPEGTEVFAVVATAGTTNLGVVDALDEVAEAAAEYGAWFHVDGAYGGAALAAESARSHFAGIERCDSVVIDPHKWLFAPFDCCALLYRQPEVARLAHAQHASYLDPINSGSEWNPTDYGHFLTRRARGLPFWFSLATYGTDRYRDAVETVLATTRAVADEIRSRSHLRLVMEPDLSVLLFERVGWEPADYEAWSDYHARAGNVLCVPTRWEDRSMLRFCFINPTTDVDMVASVLDGLADAPPG